MANLVAEKKRTRISKKGLQDLNSLLIDRKFGRPEDFIEIFIYDMNNDIIASETNYRDYSIGQTTKGLAEEINIDPLPVLNRNGLYTGKYKLNINIQKRKIFNTTTPAFSIKTISQTRTEIQLSTTEGNTRLDSNSRNFIKAIQNSAYFRDFTLNSGVDISMSELRDAITTCETVDSGVYQLVIDSTDGLMKFWSSNMTGEQTSTAYECNTIGDALIRVTSPIRKAFTKNDRVNIYFNDDFGETEGKPLVAFSTNVCLIRAPYVQLEVE